MKTYVQIDENDCGISVTQSLINHYYGIDVSKKAIYKYANINSCGLSIFDLEKLNKNFGIELESFEINFEEFKELKNKVFYVTLVSVCGRSHYVIIQKFKNYVYVFDSANGTNKVDLESFKSVFLNVIITTKCIRKKIKQVEKTGDNFVFFDIKKTMFIFTTDVLIFFCFLIGIYLNKSIFTDVLQVNYLNNLGIIVFLSFLLYLLWTFCELTKSLLQSKSKKEYLKTLYSKLFFSLENKKNYFYNKLGESNFLYLHQHVQNIAIFISEHLNIFLMNGFSIVCLALYFVFFNHIFALIVLISFILQTVYCYKSQQIKKKYFPELIRHNNEQKKLFFQLDYFLKNEWNKEKLLHLNYQLKNKLVSEINCEESLNLKSIIFEKINFFLFHLTSLVIYVVGSYLCFLKKISLDNLITSSVLFFYINKSFNKMMEIGFFYVVYKKSLEVYKNWINLETFEDSKKIAWTFPKKVNIKNLTYHNGKENVFNDVNISIYNNTFIKGKSGIGKSTLYKCISKKIFSTENAIYFDDVPINAINENDFNNSVIYQHNNSYLDEINWNAIFQNITLEEVKLIKTYLNIFNIDIQANIKFEELSSGQKQFLNILNLLKYSKKIFLLDEVASHINHLNKIDIYKNIFPIIAKKNFVICSEHNLSVQDYFVNVIDLDQIKNV